jgi:NifU-like protein
LADDDHEEGALVCKCFGIDAGMIERAVRVNKLTSLDEITNFTKAGGACKTCHEKIEDVLAEVLMALAAEGVIDNVPAPSCPVAPSAPVQKPMTNLQKIQLITTAIEDLRPTLQRDGGDIELVDIDGDTVMVNLRGSCVGCQMSSITLSGVQERLMSVLGKPVRVIPAQAA